MMAIANALLVVLVILSSSQRGLAFVTQKALLWPEEFAYTEAVFLQPSRAFMPSNRPFTIDPPSTSSKRVQRRNKPNFSRNPGLDLEVEEKEQETDQAILPIGAYYARSMKFPVLGEQAFSLRILSSGEAHLQISGMLNIDEIIPFDADISGRLNFSLNSQTHATLKKFKTKLLEAGYDVMNDTPYFRVSPYILPAVKVRMGRV